MATRIRVLKGYSTSEIEGIINNYQEMGYALVGSVSVAVKLSGEIIYVATLRKIVCSTSS